MRKIIGTASTFIGALIGAGFASGREIALYFSKTSIAAPIISGILFGFLCFFFLELGRIYNNDIFSVFGKGRFVFTFFIKLFNMIYLCAMIAGSEIVVKNLFNINGGSIITGIVSLITLFLGTEKLKDVNSIAVLAIITLVIFMFFRCQKNMVFISIGIIPSICYTGMNVFPSGYFVSQISKDMTKKENIICGIIVGIVLSTILTFTFLIISKNFDAVMPLMQTASQYHLDLAANIILYLAIYTTVLSSLAIVSDSKPVIAVIAICTANLISLFSFENIVNSIYPIIGIISTIIIVLIFLMHKKDKINSMLKKISFKKNIKKINPQIKIIYTEKQVKSK